MRATDIIAHKRDALQLSTAEINWFIEQLTAGTLPDYQASALMMAIYIQGMSRRETVDLTLAMANSGDQLDLHDAVDYAVDKHSSGGVGDKTSLVVLPIVAACGVPVAKMSGRGLGFSGGTLDKMEAIPGWQAHVPIESFKQQVREIGLVLAGQTAELAPADGKLYALRDVTATVSSIPLIAASIMSKKLAAGSDGIVLDVKVGRGAFMKTVESGRLLAETMVNIGQDAGRDVVALLSEMNQPLGYAVGNANETREAILTLHGSADTPPDFWEHCLEVGGHMLILAGGADSLDTAKEKMTAARDSGRALSKFRQMVEAQGGSGRFVDRPDLLEQPPFVADITINRGGWVEEIDAAAIGMASVLLGAGREKKGDSIDYRVGINLMIKVGDTVKANQVVGQVLAATEATLQAGNAAVLQALTVSDQPVKPLPHFYGTVT
ncbi:MAG: thymidine phosphorylase [Ardenticatenaceae bacterium]|nr:thymidine phosphorylase [Ardenticatenaceae bacterium]